MCGSLADWVLVFVTLCAVIVAGIALWFSRKSNQIAQSVYADDVRARNEAQARLVYAVVHGASVYFKGQTIAAPEVDHSLTQVGGNVLGIKEDEARSTYALDDLTIVDLEIRNDSNEIIGAFQAQLFDPTTQELLPGSSGADFVRPGQSSSLIRIAVPGKRAILTPEISFRDSAGLYWSRRGFEPIQSLDEERRNLFARLAQIWVK